jgi:glycosyltransferase involved in cell wall biosynthesis
MELPSKINKLSLFMVLLPPPYGGVEILCTDIIESVAFKKRSGAYYLDASIRTDNKNRGNIDISSIIILFQVLIKYLKLLIKVDVVWLYISSSPVGFLKDSLFILLAKVLRKEVVINYQGDMFNEYYEIQPRIIRLYIRTILKHPKTIIVSTKRGYSNFKFINQSNVLALSNGFNVDKYQHIPTSSPNAIFTIFFIGHLTYPKGFYHLIKAYKKLYRQCNGKIRLYYAGEYIPPRRELTIFLSNQEKEFYLKKQKMIHDEIELFIDESDDYNAEYLGLINHNEKVLYYSIADICVFPSYTESFGNTVVESLLMGTPVIATNVGIFASIIEKCEVGKIVEFGNVDMIYRNMDFLMQNPLVRNKMGRNGSLYAHEKFDVENKMKYIFDCIDQ